MAYQDAKTVMPMTEWNGARREVSLKRGNLLEFNPETQSFLALCITSSDFSALILSVPFPVL